MADHRDEFQKMCDQWDSALKKGIFKTKPAAPAPKVERDYGMSPQMAAIAGNSENINDVDYWNAVFRLSRGEEVDIRAVDDNGDPTVIHEELVVKAKGTNANPIPRWTKGKDQKNIPSGWFDGDDFDRLMKMKEDLHALGDKLATHDGLSQKTKAEAVLTKIRNLQKGIDSLSSSFTLPKEEK